MTSLSKRPVFLRSCIISRVVVIGQLCEAQLWIVLAEARQSLRTKLISIQINNMVQNLPESFARHNCCCFQSRLETDREGRVHQQENAGGRYQECGRKKHPLLSLRPGQSEAGPMSSGESRSYLPVQCLRLQEQRESRNAIYCWQ